MNPDDEYDEDDISISEEDEDEQDSQFDEEIDPDANIGEIDDDILDDDEEALEESAHYLQKFDASLQNNVISQFHPELQSHNYEEVKRLTQIKRNAKGEIDDPLHTTLPFITKYEMTRVLGERAKQLTAGSEPLVKIDDSILDEYTIALAEFKEKKIPFIIERPLNGVCGVCEYWRLEDLEILIS
jgi:DNA-directed RNA polymerase subunit K/omega